MKLKINRAVLLAAVGRSATTAKRGMSVAATADRILLEATEGGDVVVAATDLEVTIISTVSASEVYTAGRCVPTASVLLETLKAMGSEEVILSRGDGEAMLVAEVGGAASFEVLAAEADSYPRLPNAATVGFAEIGDCAPVIAAIRSVLFSASKDESRPNLCGVYLADGGDKLRATTTDGHRLSSTPAALDGVALARLTGALGGVLVPTGGANEIVRLGSERLVSAIGLQDNNIAVRAGADGDRVVLFVRLIDANYPDYKNVIPKGVTHVVEVDRAALLGALRKMHVARGKGATLRFETSLVGGTVTLTAKNPDRGTARDVVPIGDWTGDPLRIDVSVQYLREAVESLDGARVQLRLNEALSPIVVCGEAPETTRNGMVLSDLRVIMPMRL